MVFVGKLLNVPKCIHNTIHIKMYMLNADRLAYLTPIIFFVGYSVLVHPFPYTAPLLTEDEKV